MIVENLPILPNCKPTAKWLIFPIRRFTIHSTAFNNVFVAEDGANREWQGGFLLSVIRTDVGAGTIEAVLQK